MSIIVVKGSNISSPIDAVSLVGSDNGTQTVNVASPSITTTSSNDLLAGFAKVSAGAVFQAGTGFTQQAGASSNFLDAETGRGSNPGNLQRDLHAQPAANLAVGRRGRGQQSEPNESVVDGIDGGRRNDRQLLGGALPGSRLQQLRSDRYYNGTTTFNDTGLAASTSYQLPSSGPGHEQQCGALLNCCEHQHARSDSFFAWEPNDVRHRPIRKSISRGRHRRRPAERSAITWWNVARAPAAPTSPRSARRRALPTTTPV